MASERAPSGSEATAGRRRTRHEQEDAKAAIPQRAVRRHERAASRRRTRDIPPEPIAAAHPAQV
ncbi:hypothetical protein V5F38_11230 [Xanthobacter sp. V0B-10]|uniref:hypothetical protein n=1 Tax=Xanthobacter albus TaxID=3119929 RepID=UPI0037271EDD